jgi:hypothetical protein
MPLKFSLPPPVLEQNASDDDQEADGCGIINWFTDDEMQHYQ